MTDAATSSASVAPRSSFARVTPGNRSKAWSSHSPVVMAMLQGNRMETCDDVRTMMMDCMATRSEESICKTASAYFQTCLRQI
mmetsp:Transcript_6848/g.13945  ORF Transcript_6848/g.13945 Transcript_6848/m.13945 type:complete len:83 (-) Transcript_6848:168-416(-)